MHDGRPCRKPDGGFSPKSVLEPEGECYDPVKLAQAPPPPPPLSPTPIPKRLAHTQSFLLTV